jgi:hypothetical protein
MQTMSNRGRPVAPASAPLVMGFVGGVEGVLLRSATHVRLLDRDHTGYSWWEYRPYGGFGVCFARMDHGARGQVAMTGSACGRPGLSGPVVGWASWVCFPGETLEHAVDVGGVAVDGIATVSTVDRAGHVLVTAKLVKNHYAVPDDGSSQAVKIVFKNRAGKTLLVKTAPWTPRCDRGGVTPAPLPGV